MKCFDKCNLNTKAKLQLSCHCSSAVWGESSTKSWEVSRGCASSPCSWSTSIPWSLGEQRGAIRYGYPRKKGKLRWKCRADEPKRKKKTTKQLPDVFFNYWICLLKKKSTLSLGGRHHPSERHIGGPRSCKRQPATEAGSPVLLHDLSQLFPSTCLFLFGITELVTQAVFWRLPSPLLPLWNY